MLDRYDQNVNWGGWINIIKREDKIVQVNYGGRGFSGYDLAKYTIWIHFHATELIFPIKPLPSQPVRETGVIWFQKFWSAFACTRK